MKSIHFALLLLCVCFITTTLASSIGTLGNNLSYALTDDELKAYREQVDFDVYNLIQQGGHCEPYNQTICGNIRSGTSVYVQDSSSQDEIAKSLEEAFFLLRVSESGECRESLTSYLCAQYFPLCTIDSNTLQPASNQPCYPVCQRFNETCPQLVDRFALIPQQLKPLCANPSSSECGYHLDQSASFSVNIGPCPPPLVSVTGDGGILGGTCAEPCPILMWTQSEYKRMDIMSEILGIISLLTSAFITLTWIVFPKMRQKQYIFWFFVCSFFLSLFLWIGLRLRGSAVAASTHCRTETEEYQMGGYCIWQGMTTIYFLISGTAWWMIQSLDIFLKVVIGLRAIFIDGSTGSRIREISYHVFAWGIGAVCVIGALAFEQIGGYNNGASFCLFSTGRNSTQTRDVSYGFFYYPLIVMCALGVIGIAATFVKLVVFKFSTKSAITVSAFVRIFVLVLTMLGVCIIIVLYKFLGADNVEKWRQSAEEFYTCLLFAKDNPFEQIDCGSNPKERMPIALKFLYDLIPIAPGILCFLCYGIQFELYTSWLGLFYDKCGCACGRKYSPKGDTGSSYTDKSTNNQSKTNSTLASTTAAQSTTTGGSTVASKPNRAGMFKGTQRAKMTNTDAPSRADSNAELVNRSSAPSQSGMVTESQVELQDMQDME